MIGGIGRHGRTRRDAANLAAHLLKDSDAKVMIANSVAPGLREIMDDMLLARDGSRASSAFLHAYLSPERSMSDADLRKAARMVLLHFGAEDHQAAVVFHDKERRGGHGGRHVHIVVGRVGPEGQVIPSGYEIVKMETAVRLIEYELGERPTLGRHHASAVRWMRSNGLRDAADWLEAAHGPEPSKPSSAASPGKRKLLERQGVNLGAVRQSVRKSWIGSETPQAFAAAMAAAGLTVAPGAKAGVWIVTQGDREVGALDRILRIKRRDVAAWMSPLASQASVPGAAPARAVRTQQLRRDRVAQQAERGTLAKVDLDEIRWIAEEMGRRAAEYRRVSAGGISERERLKRQIRAGMEFLSTKGASGKGVHAQDLPPAAYDTLAETVKPGFRR